MTSHGVTPGWTAHEHTDLEVEVLTPYKHIETCKGCGAQRRVYTRAGQYLAGHWMAPEHVPPAPG